MLAVAAPDVEQCLERMPAAPASIASAPVWDSRARALSMGSAVECNEDDRRQSGCGLVIGVLRWQWLTEPTARERERRTLRVELRERQKSARCLNT